MTFKTSILAAGVAVAAMAATVSPASAAVIVNAITGGSYVGGAFEAGDIGTIMGIKLLKINTYDFTFSVAPDAVVVLTQVQASIGGPQNIDFTIYSGTPSVPGAAIDTSALTHGPSLTDVLGVGNYFIQIDTIAKNNELLTGGLDVSGVPEPATWGMMLFGVAGLGAVLRRNRRNPGLAAA